MEGELKELIAQKDKIEKQIQELNNQIVGLDETKDLKRVVDHEGFPRADLDFGELANYRNLKRRRAELNNDHLALMKDIQKKLHALHATYKETNQEVSSETTEPKTQTEKMMKKQQKVHEEEQKKPTPVYKIDYLTPFAKISIVQPTSPAEKGGLKVGDLLSEFSSINVYSMDWQKQIVSVVKEGVQLKLVVLRLCASEQNGKEYPSFELKDKNMYYKIVLDLTPEKWEGRGLLGCKIDSV